MVSVRKKIITASVFILTVIFGIISFQSGSISQFSLNESLQLDSPYIVRDYGSFRYILDKQRTRIVIVEKNTNVVKTVLPDSKNNADSFTYADDFLVDENGYVYVKEGAWNGNKISREAVLVYDTNGKYIRTLIDTNHTDFVNKHKMMLLSVKNNTLKYAVKENNRIDVVSYNMNEKASDMPVSSTISYPFENAFDFINDMAEDYEGNIYAIDKPGNFFQLEKPAFTDRHTVLSTGGTIKLIYKAEKNEFPNWIESASPGKLLFTELYSDSVKELDLETGKTSLILENTGAVTVTPLSFSDLKNPLNNKKMIKRQMIFILSFIVFIVCIFYLVLTVVITFVKSSLNVIKKICVYMIIIVILVAGVITFRLTGEFSKIMQNQILAQMENMAYSVANTIKPATLEKIDSADDFASPEYREMILNMQNVIDPKLDVNGNVYCDIFKYDEKHGAYACAYLDQAIGTYFPLTEGEIEEIKQIYETASSCRSSKDDTSASYIYVSVPVMNDARKVCGVVSVMMENYIFKGQINEMRKNVLLGIIVTVIFVWLLMGEALSYILSKAEVQMEQEKKKAALSVSENSEHTENSKVAENAENAINANNSKEEKVFPHYYIRLMVFALFTSYNMTTTFLPMVVAKGALDSLGENCSNFIAALPLSINLFAVGLMALFCEGIIKKIGFKKIIILGSALSAIGNLLLFFFTSNYIMIFISLILDGVGVGLTTNSMYMMVSKIPNPKNRTSGYAAYNAAQTSGINFGMLFGAALAPNFSRNAIFPIVTAMWVIAAVIFILLWKTLGIESEKNENSDAKNVKIENSVTRVLKFLSNRRIWSYILLVQAPFALMGSFVYYYLPLYSDTNGMSEVVVAVLMMLYSVFAIYLGNGLTKWVINKTGPVSPYMSIILCIAAVLIYAFTGNFAGLLTAIFILGLANGFGRSVQHSHFSILPECENYGVSEAMGIFNFTDFIGQSFGPTVMALVFLSKSMKFSTGIFAISLLILSILHFVINLTKKTSGGNS